MDFYQQVNNQWLLDNKIPDDYQRWGCFEEVHEITQQRVRDIVEEEEKSLYGLLYRSGMNMMNRNKTGLAPLKDIFKQIEDVDYDTLEELMSVFHRYGMSMPFNRYVSGDAKNSSTNVVYVCQGGLGLPDRDYYTDDDKKVQQEAYQACLTEIFKRVGDRFTVPIEEIVDKVYLVEKNIATYHLTRTERRDPIKTYNSFLYDNLATEFSNIDWNGLLSNSKPRKVIVESVDYINRVSDYLKKLDLTTIKYYLYSRVLFTFSPYLDDIQYNIYFNYCKVLTGQKEPKPLWKRVLAMVETLLGEQIGQTYVQKFFPESSKSDMITLVTNLIKAFETRLKKVIWMGEETKSKALEKLSTLRFKIGFPDKWRNYDDLSFTSEEYFDCYIKCHQFEFDYEWKQYDKPVDKLKWEMNAQEINAYYHPTQHEIVFPAGILQTPFYSPNYTLAENYGAIGAVIGHEITHGFDDQGCHYDKEGNLEEWWTEEDSVEFKRLTSILVDQYNQYTVEDTHLNGELTLGENIADLGGVTISYQAWKELSGDRIKHGRLFFESWARVWRNLIRPEEAKRLVVIDPHSPGKYRVNGVLQNVPEYYQTLGLKPPEKCVKIW